MAKQRIHKPELITYGPFLECSVNAQLLVILLQNFCDDDGNHPANLKSIKAKVFPSHDFTLEQIGEFVKELLDNGLLSQYEVENNCFYHIIGWEIEGHPMHQIINITNDSVLPESIKKVFNHWVKVMKPRRYKLTPKIGRMIQNQLRIFSIEEVFLAIEGCVHDDFLMGVDPMSEGKKYNTLEYIFRERHFQKLIGYAEFPPSPVLTKEKRKETHAEYAARMFKEEEESSR